MKKLLLGLLILAACKSTGPIVEPPPVEPPAGGGTLPTAAITQIVKASSCASYSWKDRGKSSVGYVKGMVTSFALSVCLAKPQTFLGSSDKDALAFYNVNPNLVDTYTFLLGLGMRESSGHRCEGRDASAGNTSSDTAEAGLFQTSANSAVASSSLRPIAEYYLTHKGECLDEVFQEGDSHCTTQNLRTYGSGEGATFQQLSKSCPRFAVNWAAVGIRVIRRHWGPIGRREVEFRSDCRDMLSQIEAIVKPTCK